MRKSVQQVLANKDASPFLCCFVVVVVVVVIVFVVIVVVAVVSWLLSSSSLSLSSSSFCGGNNQIVFAKIPVSYCFQEGKTRQTETLKDRQRWRVEKLLAKKIVMVIAALKMSKKLEFWRNEECVPDGPTDRRTDRPTDGRTVKPSYRDARTHLKTQEHGVPYSNSWQSGRPACWRPGSEA